MYDPDVIDHILDAKEYPPTDEQRSLVDTIARAFYRNRDRRTVIVCKAVAGAGKTATCLDVYNVLTSNLEGQTLQLVAFNVKAKDEMIARGVESKHAKTLNGLGHANLNYYARGRGLKLDVQNGTKVTNILRTTDPELAKIAPARRFAKKLIDFVKAHALKTFDRPTLEHLADHYEVFIDLSYDECEDEYNISLDELETKTYEWIGRAMVVNNKVPKEGTWVIDYNDQVYLPVVLGIRCFQNDLMIVDEAQDLSLANKHLVDKCLKKNGVLVLVGDDYQCIYAWRGCEVDGLSKTLQRTRLEPVAAPLTYNWRSGRQIIERAQEICPDIQCGNGKDAVVESQKLEDFEITKLTGDTAVLSRLRAPLISYAIECLKADVPFTFQFSLKFLTDTIKFVGDESLSIRAFKRRLAHYVETKTELYRQQDADTALEDLEDFAAIMEVLLEKVRTTDKVSDLVEYIKQLDRKIRESDGSLTLSTMHGSKGLEWETTYLVGYEEIGNRARKDWQEVEARNLRFVAVTRAKTSLIFLQEMAA
jgi:hypothetical protein